MRKDTFSIRFYNHLLPRTLKENCPQESAIFSDTFEAQDQSKTAKKHLIILFKDFMANDLHAKVVLFGSTNVPSE